jgi:hypothetical protein
MSLKHPSSKQKNNLNLVGKDIGVKLDANGNLVPGQLQPAGATKSNLEKDGALLSVENDNISASNQIHPMVGLSNRTVVDNEEIVYEYDDAGVFKGWHKKAL